MTKTIRIGEEYPHPWLNVFLMMRFEESEQQDQIVSVLTSRLRHYGLNLLRADQRHYAESLWENVTGYMDACDLGIAVFEQMNQRYFNSNVSLELGYMLGQRKSVLILKERRLESLPSDVTGRLYREFDHFDIPGSLAAPLRSWLVDIGFAKSGNQKLVLFVSKGGTCRCAMAKVILREALKGRQLPFNLRVLSVAHEFGDSDVASQGARGAVADRYGEDLLREHRVIRRSPGLAEEADLILVMEDKLRSGFPEEKTFVFNEFFGGSGDVSDPWRVHEDEGTRQRYAKCFDHLRNVIEANVVQLVRHLGRGDVSGGGRS